MKRVTCWLCSGGEDPPERGRCTDCDGSCVVEVPDYPAVGVVYRGGKGMVDLITGDLLWGLVNRRVLVTAVMPDYIIAKVLAPRAKEVSVWWVDRATWNVEPVRHPGTVMGGTP